MAHRRRSDCPIHFSLEIFGDRWTLLVVRDLMFKGRTTYGEFLAGGEQIATNVLADRLKRLAEAGLVTRSPDPHHGNRVHYRLTDKGLGLMPMLVEMIAWGARHDPQTAASEAFVARVHSDREALLAELRRAVEQPPGANSASE